MDGNLGKAAGFVLWSLALVCGTAAAQDYPNRRVRVIVPYAAGGPVDITSRIVSPKLSELLGQPVVVENRPGGGTLIGTRAALQAPPDGYTLSIQATTLALNSLAYKAPGYKFSDFVPLYPLTASPFVLSVHESVPVKNLAELVAYGRANPGKLSSVSLGASSITQLTLERFKVAAGISTLSVGYGGSGLANQALVTGVVDMFMDGNVTAFLTAKSGKTRMLAITGTQRSKTAPEVPTFIELGYPTMFMRSWVAAFATAKTPEPIVQRLKNDFARVLGLPEVRERIVALGSDVYPGPPQDFPTFIREDLVLWEQDIRRAGLSLEE